MVLENITEKAYSDLYKETFVDPLGLTGTYDRTPESDEKSFIPVNASISWYDTDLHAYGPGGGHFSTINDLRKIGSAILNSTLMPAAHTRRWMKPASFTSDERVVVGAPWEIFRAPINRTMWMYTKSGDLGMYSANTILFPEYGVGMSVIAAGFKASATSRIVSDIMTTAFVPSIEQAAKEEAVPAYAGVYGDDTNSSITLDVREDEPGLVLSSWTMAGVNVFDLISEAFETTSPIAVNVYPRGLKDGKVEAWQALFVAQSPKLAGVFSGTCTTWFGAESLIYGGKSLGEFTFEVDDDGAESLTFRMLDMTLPKVSGSLRKKKVSS
jgi:hypothetical protein